MSAGRDAEGCWQVLDEPDTDTQLRQFEDALVESRQNARFEASFGTTCLDELPFRPSVRSGMTKKKSRKYEVTTEAQLRKSILSFAEVVALELNQDPRRGLSLERELRSRVIEFRDAWDDSAIGHEVAQMIKAPLKSAIHEAKYLERKSA